MRLWTLQPSAIADQVESGERFSCDPTIAECYNLDEQFRASYHWLVAEMSPLIPRPEGVELPIWAWAKNYGLNQKPDRRRLLFSNYSKDDAILELEVPDGLVLLSDFDEWHSVLNNCPIQSDEEWELEPDREFSEAEKLESWKQVFAVESKDFVQACFWTIEPEYLVKVHRLRSRRAA